LDGDAGAGKFFADHAADDDLDQRDQIIVRLRSQHLP
jgi:hypothetical protein